MSAATIDLTGVDIPTNRTYLNSRQEQEYTEEIKGLEATLNDPKARLENVGEVRKQLARVRKDLEQQAPPEVTGIQKDRIAAEAKELLAKMMEGMPSQEEMRKCPPGAIGKHRSWEMENKPRIIRYRNIMRILNRGNEDPDMASIEKFRPRTSTLNMDNAVIPGASYHIPPDTEQYKQNYDRTFGGGEVSADAVGKLLAKIEALEKRIDVPKASATPARPVAPSTGPVVGGCGKEFGNVGGYRSHRNHCEQCRENGPE